MIFPNPLNFLNVLCAKSLFSLLVYLALKFTGIEYTEMVHDTSNYLWVLRKWTLSFNHQGTNRPFLKCWQRLGLREAFITYLKVAQSWFEVLTVNQPY